MKKYTTLPKPVISAALDTIHEIVKPTYGPAGRGVLIDHRFEQSIIDDGFSIIEELEVKDELKQAVINYVRDASRQTNKRAGDGTTSSFLLTYALVKEALKASDNSLVATDDTALADELKAAGEDAIKQLKKLSKKIKTVEDLERIALNSYKNPTIAKLIAEMVHKVGPDGVISIDNSDAFETTTDVVTGMTFDRGFVSPYMNGADGGANKLDNPLIIITDEPINAIAEQFRDVLGKAMLAGTKNFLVIADSVDGSALNTFVVNRLKGLANIVAIRAPGYGDRRYDLFEDIATVVGATFLTAKKGRPLSSITSEDMGSAKLVTVTQDDTTIVDGVGSREALNDRIRLIKPLTERGAEFDKEHAKKRIAALTGGIGVISVGANTETEQKAVKAKVDDAVHATQLAFKEGVVAGGGEAFANLKTSSALLNTALQYPKQVLEENGKKKLTKGAEDATGVVQAALESAISVATTLITCAGIITEEREEKKKTNDD